MGADQPRRQPGGRSPWLTMIAHVYVDHGVRHLDRPFDYAVPPQWEALVVPGIRVRVRFSGRLLPGWVVGVAETSEQPNVLPLARVISSEVVLPPESVALIRAVADHCAGTFADVARLAVPPRHGKVEAAEQHPLVDDIKGTLVSGPVDGYPGGEALRRALRGGRSPRVSWCVAPVAANEGDWALGLADLAADTVSSGRDALIIVPDAKDCVSAVAATRRRVTPQAIVSLSAAKGVQARYAAFLSALRGRARVVVGTRAAIYTPVKNLGLIAVWDDGDHSLAEPHFPYPALRDVAVIRASQTHAGVVFSGYSRSVAVHDWVEKGWLGEVGLTPAIARRIAPRVRIASQDDRALEKDPLAHTSRLPHDVFTAIQAGLTRGPVLVWVPWLGHRRNFLCRSCGLPMRCLCGSGFEEKQNAVVVCGGCGRPDRAWKCACGSTTWKAVTSGSARWSEELSRAFPATSVLRSDSTAQVKRVQSDSVIIVSTPGCEPPADSGYSAAVILDAVGFLSRPDIRVGEDAVRRWLSVAALVRPASRDGTVMIVGPSTQRSVQAVMRIDPVGFAARELGDRREAEFPPATRMAVFQGDEDQVAWVAAKLARVAYAGVLGPFEGAEPEETKLIARVNASHGEEFAALVCSLACERSQSRRAGRLWSRLDPDWLGG